jgi:hypothetical protein
MPPALDRLLARPSALRLLRALVDAPEWPAIPAICCRVYSTGKEKPPAGGWPRWRDKARPKSYEADGSPGDGAVGYQDTAQWARELQRQERRYGLAGIQNVWENNHTLRLPTEDTPDAECLWGTFLRHPDLVFPVLSHAAYLHRKTGAVYPHLYELCMGHWLAHERHCLDALEYHRQMLHNFKFERLPLRQLAHKGRETWPPQAYNVLLEIYEASNERDLYDDVIPALLARGSVTAVKQWHALCIRRGDLPSDKLASHPLVHRLGTDSANLSDAETKFLCTVLGAEPAQLSKMNGQLLRRLLGRDMAPVRFNDATCARMFATRTFAPEGVIKGLAMVGVNEIGPLAVRTMAARVDPISDLPQLFEQLKSLGIALQGCVFSVALEKFAAEKQWLVVRSMLESDQHPEVYDDPKVQRELLDFYLQQQDWHQAHRTLAILSLFHNDASAQSWNILLQAHTRVFATRRGDSRRVEQTIQLMRDNHVMLTPESILAIRGILRRRQRGHKPVRMRQTRFDDLRFVQRTFVTILESGIGQIEPSMWWEILRRLGMLGRFRELRRLTFWLLCWYAPRGGTEFDALPRPHALDTANQRLRAALPNAHPNAYFRNPHHLAQKTEPEHPIRQLLPPTFQQGLIVWGFRAGLLPNAPLEQSMLPPPLSKLSYRPRLIESGVLNRLDWSVGLRFLVELRDHGLRVHPHTVVKSVQMMLMHMFGRGQSRKRENRVMAAANTLAAKEYMREVNRIWGRPLLIERRQAESWGLYGRRLDPRSRRHARMRGYLRVEEIVPEWHESIRHFTLDAEADAQGDDALHAVGLCEESSTQSDPTTAQDSHLVAQNLLDTPTEEGRAQGGSSSEVDEAAKEHSEQDMTVAESSSALKG